MTGQPSMEWQRSQYDQPDGPAVEMAVDPVNGDVSVRRGGTEDSPVLRFSGDEWLRFTRGLFDQEVGVLPGGE